MNPQPTFIGDWKKKFGEDYQIPKEILDLLPDQSHDNSLCPSFLVGYKAEGKRQYEVTLWVEHIDPKKRCKECRASRFHFMRLDQVTGECDGLVDTDDLELALKYVKSYQEYLIDKVKCDPAKPKCLQCGNMNMASQGKDVICDQCHIKCGEIPD